MTPSIHFRQVHRNQLKGFTLLEMMVTVAIVAILATMAYPGYSDLIRQWRRDGATKAFVADLQLARSTAIKTSRSVTICTSSNGTSCGTATDWKSGWIIIDGNNTIISATSAPQGVSGMPSGVKSFVFLPNGLMGSAAGTLTITATGTPSGSTVNKVDITQVGRAKISKATS